MITFITTIELLVLLAIQAEGPESWASFAKFLVGLGVGLLVVSGGLFMIAWSVAQKARSQWFGLAREWASSDDFRAAVIAARRDIAEREVLEMRNEIDRRIEAHNSRDNLDAHRAAIGHACRNIVGDTTGSRFADLEARVDRLEKK